MKAATTPNPPVCRHTLPPSPWQAPDGGWLTIVYDQGSGTQRTDTDPTAGRAVAVVYASSRDECQQRAATVLLALKREFQPPPPTASEIGRRIREERSKRGWTGRELARRSGFSTTNVSNTERGKHRPNKNTLRRYAEVLGVSVRDLLGDA